MSQARVSYLFPPVPHEAGTLLHLWVPSQPSDRQKRRRHRGSCSQLPGKRTASPPLPSLPPSAPPVGSAFHDACPRPTSSNLPLTCAPTDLWSVEHCLDEMADLYLYWHRRHIYHTRLASQPALHVSIMGSGPEAVVLLHGICMSSSFWTDGLMRFMSREALQMYTFYCPDLVGYGRSRQMPIQDNYSRTEQAGAVLRDVVSRYGLTSYHLIGHSYGGLVCMDIAVRATDAVKSLILLAPAYFESEQRAYSTLTGVPFPVKHVVMYPELGRLLIRFLNAVRPYLAPLASKIIPVSELPELSVWDFFGIDPDATLGTIYTIIHDRVDDLMSALEERMLRVFVAHGTHDGVVDYRQCTKLRSRYSNVVLKTLPGLVHHFPTSHAKLTADIVEHQLTNYRVSRERHMP